MEKIQRKMDRRVIKTKKAIRNAFAELLVEKEVSQITVKNIAEIANINRKTFYSYYSDVYELVDDIENDIVSAFDEVLVDVDFCLWLQDPREIFIRLTNIINSDLDFYSHIMKMHGNVGLTSKIIDAIKQRIKQPFTEQIKTDEATTALILDYSISGMVAVYQKWFNSNRTKSLDELSQQISLIIVSGMNGLLRG